MDIPTKQETQEQFGKVARRYRISVDHEVSDDRDFLASRMQLSPDMLALDVATGGGHTAVTFSQFVRRVVASDLTPRMLAEARELADEKECGNVLFLAADAESLPFAKESFDRVTCRIAPHHFPEIRSAVREMARITRRGGLIGIIDSVVPEDPLLDSFINTVERERDPSHVRSYTVAEWGAFFKEARIDLIHASSMWKAHPFAEWVDRTGRPKSVQRKIERTFLKASPLVKTFFRIRIQDGQLLSYSDEKGVFIGRKL